MSANSVVGAEMTLNLIGRGVQDWLWQRRSQR